LNELVRRSKRELNRLAGAYVRRERRISSEPFRVRITAAAPHCRQL
jgi:hypothetical protein